MEWIPIVIKTQSGDVTLGFGELRDNRLEVTTLERLTLHAVCDALDRQAAADDQRIHDQRTQAQEPTDVSEAKGAGSQVPQAD